MILLGLRRFHIFIEKVSMCSIRTIMIMAKTKVQVALASGKRPETAIAEPSIIVHGSFNKDLVGETRVCPYSPLEFHTFIPWVCKQWCASTAVIITRRAHGIYFSHT